MRSFGRLVLALLALVGVTPVGSPRPAAATGETAGAELTTLAGASPAPTPGTEAAMSPSDVLAAGDRLYVADALYSRIWRIDRTSGVAEAAYSFPVKTLRPYSYQPVGAHPALIALALDPAGDLIVADRGGNRVLRIGQGASATATVVAGTGTAGYSGDGGGATQARLSEPAGVAVDAWGAVYVADTGNHVLRRIDPTGVITTVAGTGTLGFSGDGGPAAAAQLAYPTAVAMDRDDRLLVADAGNERLRRVDATGTITTIAGGGELKQGPDPEYCPTGPATEVWLGAVSDVAVAATGDVLLAAGRCIRRLSAGTLTNAVGSSGWVYGTPPDGSLAPLNEGVAVTVAADGTIYLAEAGLSRVRRVGTDGHISTVAGRIMVDPRDVPVGPRLGSGEWRPARSAQLSDVGGMATAADGSLVVSGGQSSIFSIGRDGLLVPVGGYPFEATGLPPLGGNDIFGLTADADGSIVFADGVVRRLSTTGAVDTIAGQGPCSPDSGDGGPAPEAMLYSARDVARGPDGSLYIAELGMNRLRRIAPDGIISTFAGNKGPVSCAGETRVPSDTLAGPTAVAVSATGEVYAADPTCVRRVHPDGTVECLARMTWPAPDDPDWDYHFVSEPDVVVDAAGAVVFTDPFAGVVRRLGPDGNLTTVAGTGERRCAAESGPATETPLAIPTRLALTGDGAIAVYEAGCHRIRKVGGSRRPAVRRVAGGDRLVTAVEASRDSFASGSAPAAVLARADSFPDALAGIPLAARRGGPLLLTTPDGLHPWAEAELRRVLSAQGTVYLLGGEAAISLAVERRVRDLGWQATRLGGGDRFETAVAVANNLGATTTVMLTTGLDFPDALTAAPAAAALGGTVVLTDGPRMPAASQAYLEANQSARLIAVGGPAGAARPGSEVIAGTDRYDTAARVAQALFPSPSTVGVATGLRFPDALAGGAHAAHASAPLLLAGADGLPAVAERYLGEAAPAITEGVVYGGPAVLPGRVVSQLGSAV